MNSHALALAPVAANPLVLANRELRNDARIEGLSRFEDATWDLTPGIFEDHSTKTTLTFEVFPERWRTAVKTYFWHVINDETLRPLASGPAEARPSLRTVSFIRPHLLRLLDWFESKNFETLEKATPKVLDELLGDLGTTGLTYAQKRHIITETRRLWSYRDLVPSTLRLPAVAPWLDERSYDLLGRPPQRRGNLTPRIADETLVPLMAWAMRFIEDFADDIIASYHQYHELIKHEYRHRPSAQQESIAPSTRKKRLRLALRELKDAGLGLPGRVLPDGTREVRWQHLGRLARGPGASYPRYDQQVITRSKLFIDDDAYLMVPCTRLLDGKLWRGRYLTWDEIIPLTTHLQTACFIVVSYLSGMRPGEVLSLDRDCLKFDTSTGLWNVVGKRWKSAKEKDGQKVAQGSQRSVPWVVHPVAAQAVSVLIRLEADSLLFPNSIRPKPLRGQKAPDNLRPGRARTSSQIGTDIINFVTWVNKYCALNARADTIPEDPNGRISGSRFRRSLAWHLVRRPRGLVAAAIQYGHVATYVTQGYSGTYASGFPDELSMERWLERIEDVQALETYLDGGGHVSGPAARELNHRTRQASAKFLGRCQWKF
ncbi:hypothetical protein DQ353_20220 [Arthrobacter sp. AQ5-05]|uniref:hypothetical protein n=1 Tax=Arthrobacter sp. AQ5-05 TaxID=2184581 RepID=UPI000DCE29FA|nr:hypothetical protein [Arthrobacter sp. AQ5-05]RAX46271.1 hypothetical protein DQ353_20220 [Arthrobacter sp. AQ5-05]